MALQMSGVKRETAAARWYAAVDWYRTATEADIDAQVRKPIGERVEGDWARLACIALDQADVDPDKVRL